MDESPELGTRQARAADARRRLLEAAMKQFSNRPYDVVAIDDITRAARTAHGSLFHHFESKRGIYLAAMQAIAAQLRARRSGQGDTSSPGRQIRRELEAHLAAIAKHPEFFVSLMRGGIGADREAHEIFERDRWHSIEIVAGQLDLDGSNPTVRIPLRAWVGGTDASVLAWLQHERPFPLARLVDSGVIALGATIDAIGALDPSLNLKSARAACRAATARTTQRARVRKRR